MASPHDGHFDSDAIHEFSNAVKALTNLIYLIKVDSHSPEKVQGYVKSAEEPLRKLRELIEQEKRRSGSF